MASIHKTSSGTFKVMYRDESGKQHSKTLKTQAEAHAFMANVCKKSGKRLEEDKMTYSVYWSTSVEDTFVKLATKTVQEYRRLWEYNLEPNIGKKLVADTNRLMVENVLQDIESTSVQRHVYALWKKVCNLAIEDGYLESNPCTASLLKRLPKHVKKEKGFVSADEVPTWIEKAFSTKYGCVLALELGCGLRHEEACAVKVEDIVVDGSHAYVNVNKAIVSVSNGTELKDTKNEHSIRTVALGEPFLEPFVKALPESGFLCANNNGGPTSPSTITHNWKSWCERNHYAYVCPKDLRTSFSTLQGEAGTPDSIVSLAMGHADGAGTTRGRNYLKFTIRMMKMAADNLRDLIICEEYGEVVTAA